MGDTIRLTCNDCNKYYDLDIGHGRSDNDLNRVYSKYNEQTADIIEAKVSVAESGTWLHRKMIGYCTSCGSIQSIPTFHIKDNDKEYVTTEKCQCGGKFVLIDENDPSAMEKIKCPECGGSMNLQYTGMWD